MDKFGQDQHRQHRSCKTAPGKGRAANGNRNREPCQLAASVLVKHIFLVLDRGEAYIIVNKVDTQTCVSKRAAYTCTCTHAVALFRLTEAQAARRVYLSFQDNCRCTRCKWTFATEPPTARPRSRSNVALATGNATILHRCSGKTAREAPCRIPDTT